LLPLVYVGEPGFRHKERSWDKIHAMANPIRIGS